MALGEITLGGFGVVGLELEGVVGLDFELTGTNVSILSDRVLLATELMASRIPCE